MISNVLTSTKTLTGRLAVFFGVMAVIVSAFVYVVFITALYLSEDRVGERRILIDRNYAVGLFQSGESGELRIDDLTIAYNDLSYLPKKYLKYIEGKENFIGEVGEDPESRMVYVGEYTHEGRTHPIVLLSEIDRVELSVFELVYATTFVLALLSILIFSFGALLYRLSKRLIEPFNSLSEQLESNKLNLNEEFGVNDDAAVEFRQLTDQLNQYRREINSLVKREQAFARYSSHELRTPLTVARGANKLLLRSETTEFQSRQVERIDEAIVQMSEMVDALLGLVRYERNSDDAPLRLFSQQELETIVSKNSLQADEKEVAITLQVQSEPTIQATSAIMNMLVGNLLRNAIAATNSGTVTITLSQDSLIIEDQGEGLQEQYNPNGHGLGLLIVDDLCQRFHWDFELFNRSCSGCTAKITFQADSSESISNENLI
ncbi:sensor histidine kinase [Vibrio crassostreae]|uniref:sensor histidine kinase n=1 Tax=Vibrio crassostreae TaxID=246167 RepID=UPI000F49EAC0|nr:HAMP domain-containing sensor histidine kinase [Vibrio crassostreae]NOH73883.1 HAMP domain-containing histidine kinase [Vibrio crassostreae]NOI51799.1 HAMP domain-containing histidine kinase [Vibrio crassostreae]ROR16697.1 signal transduction histidine kinase [Vibrio crassostreae]ROR25992.1 signal transduction histidine kinase [Vibrio crassostreae]TCN91897.1 signal transduction histidine kinase [Vibrio crassostreae]